jgi:hypothetical protein
MNEEKKRPTVIPVEMVGQYRPSEQINTRARTDGNLHHAETDDQTIRIGVASVFDLCHS